MVRDGSNPARASHDQSREHPFDFEYFEFAQLRAPDGCSIIPTSYCHSPCLAQGEDRFRCFKDPVWGHALENITPFIWSDVCKDLRESCAVAYLQDSARKSLSGGGVPIHGPSGAISCLHVASGEDPARFRARFFRSVEHLRAAAAEIQQRIVNDQLAANRRTAIRLTQRQEDVLRWVIAGKTNWEIGQILDIAADTVRQHVIGLMRALGANNRTEAAAIGSHFIPKVRSVADGPPR